MRKIDVDGEEWEFSTGKGNAVIKNPRTGKKAIVDYSILTGRTWNVLERGQWKKTIDGMVTPGHVSGYIRKHLRGKT
jgi:hypothetical protein